MRFRAIVLLLASFSCWTDELVLVVAPSLSQECFDSTEDDEAILARSTNQRQRHNTVDTPARSAAVVPALRKQLTSFFQPSGQDASLVRHGGLYQLMSLQL